MSSTYSFDSFNSAELNYPLGDGEDRMLIKRSAMKKAGCSRKATHSCMYLKVCFKEVFVREYAMVLGDNPAVSHGAPVQLEWEPQDIHDPVHIDNYEKARSLWRAKDRRGFLLNAHKRVKILFAAGYTIDEIAKATMEMKEYRCMRADSLKTQGMMTGVILALLSGAAEGTGRTVKAVTILPNALAGAGKVVVNGTSKAVVGVGTEMMGLTNKVVNGTTNAAKKSGAMATAAATGGIKGTGKVVGRTSKLMVKGTTGVVKGTSKVMVGTGKVGMDVVKGTGNVVKGTGNVMMGAVARGTGSVVYGTGVLFAGTSKAGLDMMKGTTRRISRMVNVSMDSSSHHRDDDEDDDYEMSERSDMSERSFTQRASGVFLKTKAKTKNRPSMPGLARPPSLPGLARPGIIQRAISQPYKNTPFPSTPRGQSRVSMPAIPPPGGLERVTSAPMPKPKPMRRQRSLDSAKGAAAEGNGVEANLNDELLEMQDFLVQLEGMDKHKVQEIIAAEQQQKQRKHGAMSLHIKNPLAQTGPQTPSRFSMMG